VTLEVDGIARFPDAPTERGIKHIHELMKARSQGYLASIIFVIQMKGVYVFEPNRITHPEFAEALLMAVRAGVEILAFDCIVTENSLEGDSSIPVRLE
jgi:sugar fermentation stimulation protein A